MRLAILGAGAAGMMAAATINELYPEIEVFLLEKNDSLGKKVLISGGGRCNVTTGVTDIKTVLSKYPRGNKFLTTAMYHFPPSEVYAWFEAHGVPLKIEDDSRVFPQSDDGKDVVGVFENIFAKSPTKILTKHTVVKIEKLNGMHNPPLRGAKGGVNGLVRSGIKHPPTPLKGGFVIHFKDQPSLQVNKVILTCGGQAYRSTGSTGDGYAFAEALGHTITKLAPSLNSFITLEKWPKILSGVSFEEATIIAKREKTYQFTGPFLFTHLGISGPAVFALSSMVAFEDYGPKNPLHIFIDLIPSLPFPELIEEFKKQITEHPKKNFKNTIHRVVPKSVAELICTELKVNGEKRNAEVAKHELEIVAEWLKQAPLSVIGRGAGDEFVTAGGVNTSEVDPRTMESKITPGLFFAGEILDVDGFTGGFNLQAAWATGRVAGKSVEE
jgi:predicted Rossmann fold flavoprotein